MLVVGTVREFEAFQVALGMPDEYWTVVDRDFVPVALADITCASCGSGAGGR